MDGWMDGRTDGRTGGRAGGRADRQTKQLSMLNNANNHIHSSYLLAGSLRLIMILALGFT